MRRARSASFLVAIAVLLLLAFSSIAAAATVPTGFQDSVRFEGLNQPTSFKFAPDGRTFVAQKGGKIVVYQANALPNASPEVFVDLRKAVYDNQDRGLLSLALDPKFDQGRPYVYALYTYDHELGAPPGPPIGPPKYGEAPNYEGDPCPTPNDGCTVSGRLVRFTAAGNQAVPGSEEVLLEDWCQQYLSHTVGDLAFGPEGALFVSGGEGASYVTPDYGQFGNPCGDPGGPKGSNLTPPSAEGGSLRSQSLLSPSGQVGLDGTLLRLDPDSGEGFPGNPLAASANANARRIIGFGFRNPFRFAINPAGDKVFVSNVGSGTDEEIDRLPTQPVVPYNSGWPCYEGLVSNFQFNSQGLAACTRLYSQPGSTSPPFFYYDHAAGVAPGDPCPGGSGSAISGAAFYQGASYPSAYKNAFFFADSVRGCIYVMFSDDGEPDPQSVTAFVSDTDPYAGADIEQGPNGDLFYASLYGPKEGTIHRVSYDPGAPQAVLSVNQEWGPANFEFKFDASASLDPGGNPLTYEWDLDGNGSYEIDTGAVPTVSKVFNSSINETVAVRVNDAAVMKSSVARTTVYPDDSPPKIEIDDPLESLTWGVGQTIKFDGSAKAKLGTGGAIPLTDLYWKTKLLHCPFAATKCHEHPLQVFPAKESGEFPAPDHEAPAFINLFLTASDSRGLRAEANVKIAAREVDLQLRSNPPGVALDTGSVKGKATPFAFAAVEKSAIGLTAPETAVVAGSTYAFRGWSDGGARSHTVSADAPATYTADYTLVSGPPQPPPPPPIVHKPAKILKRPPRNTTSTTAKFVFSGEAGLRFRCRIDKKKFGSCRSPRTYRQLKRGKHSFRVYPVDSTGAQVAKATVFNWKIVPKKK